MMSSIELDGWLKKNGQWSSRKDRVRTSVFNIPARIFSTDIVTTNKDSKLEGSDASNDTTSSEYDKPLDHEDVSTSFKNEEDIKRGLTCLLCGLSFNSLDEQYEHFKSQLHGLNLMRSTRNLSILSSTDIINNQNMNSDSDNDDSDDLNSSDDDSITLPNELYDHTSIDESYSRIRNIHTDTYTIQEVYDKTNGPSYLIHLSAYPNWNLQQSITTYSNINLINELNPLNTIQLNIKSIQSNPIICVFILRSGRFCGVIYNQDTVIAHKTIRKYTIRAKSGKSQSSYDNQGSKAKSAGSMLRRYGEQSLKDELKVILNEWSNLIQNSRVILLSIPKTMRSIIYDMDVLFNKEDKRIVNVPYMISKPTLDEASRIQRLYSSITFIRNNIIDKDSNSLSLINTSNIKSIITDDSKDDNLITNNIDKSLIQIDIKDDYFDDDDLQSLCQAIKDNNINNVKTIIEKVYFEYNSREDLFAIFLSMALDLDDMFTPLHIAALNGLVDIIAYLLRRGANPCKQDARSRPPYYLCKNKESRQIFRLIRGEENMESRWDWSVSGVPASITMTSLNASALAKKEKEKEKKKRAKLRKKEESIRAESDRINAADELLAKQMADQMEKELIIERAGVCSECGKSMLGIVSLDVFMRRCCSSDCVVKLRRKLAAEAAMGRMK